MSGHGVQFDRAEADALRQVNDDELPPALRQLQREDQPIRLGRHRLDTGAARNVDRRAVEPMSSRGGWSAARHPAGNDNDQSSETDNEHQAHHDNQDLEGAHGA